MIVGDAQLHAFKSACLDLRAKWCAPLHASNPLGKDLTAQGTATTDVVEADALLPDGRCPLRARARGWRNGQPGVDPPMKARSQGQQFLKFFFPPALVWIRRAASPLAIIASQPPQRRLRSRAAYAGARSER